MGRKNKKLPTNYELALSRDEYSCSVCGSKKKIAVYPKNDSLPLTPDNLEVLCIPCVSQKQNLILKVHNPTPKLILQLRDNGISDTDIAEKYLGCKRQRLYQIMTDYTKAMRVLKI